MRSTAGIKINVNRRLLTCDRNVWPGLLLPPGGNEHGDVSVTSAKEEVHSQLDSQTGEHFLVPVTESINGNQARFMRQRMSHILSIIIMNLSRVESVEDGGNRTSLGSLESCLHLRHF